MKLNLYHKIIISVFLGIIIILCTVYVPWNVIGFDNNPVEKPIGYFPIWSPPIEHLYGGPNDLSVWRAKLWNKKPNFDALELKYRKLSINTPLLSIEILAVIILMFMTLLITNIFYKNK